MSSGVDVLVVGGGPAGAAAAIWAARAGLRVRLLERVVFPRHRPGETLHPGVESIFRQLGVAKEVACASTMRHRGQAVVWGTRRGFSPFGGDMDGAWAGYQVLRERLDSILVAKARELGVEVSQPEAAVEPIVRADRVTGVRGQGDALARHVIDATGSRGWLRRHLDLSVETASPPLRAYYGYCEGEADRGDGVPCLLGDGRGWTWIAEIAPRRFHWTRLEFGSGAAVGQPPPQLAGSRPLGRIRGADVTWRYVPACAGPGYFLAGDAAAVVDPASSHGVLRALMSGMMAAHAVIQVVSRSIGEDDAIAHYRAWIAAWFNDETRRLAELYRELAPALAWGTTAMQGHASSLPVHGEAAGLGPLGTPRQPARKRVVAM